MKDFFDVMLPFLGTFVSAFFVLLFSAYLIYKTLTQRAQLQAIIRAAEDERKSERDPWRVYKFSPKKRVLRRAGNFCEWHSATGERCRISSELEVDHIYPWSAGGWTLESNAQVLCHGHHLVKGGLIPTEEEIHAISLQRKTYFPADIDTEVRWLPTDEERALHRGKRETGQ